MSQELTIPKSEKPVLMRNGVVHWVADATADKLRAVLAGQNGHMFVAISELGITINTADISGVYTLSEYNDLVKTKQGMYQCAYRKWHGKKEECQCERDSREKTRKEMERIRLAGENEPMGNARRKAIQNIIIEGREILKARGVPWAANSAYVLRRSGLNAYKKKHGIEYKVPAGAKVIEDEPLLQESK